MRAKEYAITVENGVITGRTVVTTVSYTYNADGALTKKQFTTADGTEWVINYENPEEGNPIVRFTANEKTVTSRSKTDSFGRKTFEELQLGSTFISRQFAYHEGKITPEHSENDKVKSAPTTQLVSKITLSDGRTLSYTYDEEERIIEVTETAENNGNPIAYTTEYTYDAMGQLLAEVVNGELVNEMTYDGYGNILTKNGKIYTYGDSVWKDKLTAIGDQTITYDAQGNPVTYLGYALTWEKGRQLKTFGTNSYTYNANGIRTSKTVNSVTHTYTLDGANILKESWDNNTLIPLRDNEDQVCGILYNGTPYYFLKNLQGDIIAIQDSNAQTVARYTYDAWGACTITEDTTDLNIATINPYRYRGYYYDTEIAMYYLQSRYYDPTVGRFVNGDEAAWCIVPIKHNIWVYCNSNPTNLCDSSGYNPVAVAAKAVEYVAVCALLLIAFYSLTKLVSTPSFQRMWNSFCTSVGNGLASIWKSIVDGGKAAWNWTIKKITAAIAAVVAFTVVLKADAIIRKTITRNSKERYWSATVRPDYVDLGRAITYSQAVEEVSVGRSVFTVTSAEAAAVAQAAYRNKKPVGPEINKGKKNTPGYYYHYHINGRRNKGHVFFLYW